MLRNTALTKRHTRRQDLSPPKFRTRRVGANCNSSEHPVTLERDSTKRDYLHPTAGSDASKVGAGLFAKP